MNASWDTLSLGTCLKGSPHLLESYGISLLPVLLGLCKSVRSITSASTKKSPHIAISLTLCRLRFIISSLWYCLSPTRSKTLSPVGLAGLKNHRDTVTGKGIVRGISSCSFVTAFTSSIFSISDIEASQYIMYGTPSSLVIHNNILYRSSSLLDLLTIACISLLLYKLPPLYHSFLNLSISFSIFSRFFVFILSVLRNQEAISSYFPIDISNP